MASGHPPPAPVRPTAVRYELHSLERTLERLTVLIEERSRSRSWIDKHFASLVLLLGALLTGVVTLYGTVWSGKLQQQRNELDQELARQKSEAELVLQQRAAVSQFNLQEDQQQNLRLLETCKEFQALHAQLVLRAIDEASKAGRQLTPNQITTLGTFPACGADAEPTLEVGAVLAPPPRPLPSVSLIPFALQFKPRVARRTLTVSAYASSDKREDIQSLQVPPKCSYVSHAPRITTRNVDDDTSFSVSPSNPNKDTKSLTLKATAGGKPLLGVRRWIGVELSVVVECVG
jgi:hypothetical protein